MPEKKTAEKVVIDLLDPLDSFEPTELERVEPKFIPPETSPSLPPIFQLADMLWTNARAFIPKRYRSPAEVVAAILTGRELGLGAMTSLRAFHPIDGKVEMKAETMLALALMRGVKAKWIKDGTDGEAKLQLSRQGHDASTFIYTIDMAKKAKLIKPRSGWIKHPEAMLRARVTSAAMRAYCPDALLGAYAPGELDGLGVPPSEWAEYRTVNPEEEVDAEYDEDAEEGESSSPKNNKPEDPEEY